MIKRISTERIETEVASKAIIQALDDLRRAEESKHHVVDMGVWHDAFMEDADGDTVEVDPEDIAELSEAQKANVYCRVCFGGAVLARVIGHEATYASPDDDDFLSEDEQRVLSALDSIRQAWPTEVHTGLCQLGVPAGVAKAVLETVTQQLHPLAGEPFNTDLTLYETNHEEFKRERRLLSSELEARGY